MQICLEWPQSPWTHPLQHFLHETGIQQTPPTETDSVQAAHHLEQAQTKGCQYGPIQNGMPDNSCVPHSRLEMDEGLGDHDALWLSSEPDQRGYRSLKHTAKSCCVLLKYELQLQ